MNSATLLSRPRQAAESGAVSVDLSGLGLTVLPPEIGQLTNLTTLHLRSNPLTALPPELAHLTRLERLKLHGNPLTLALPRALLGDIFDGGDAQAILRFYRAVWQAGALAVHGGQW